MCCTYTSILSILRTAGYGHCWTATGRRRRRQIPGVGVVRAGCQHKALLLLLLLALNRNTHDFIGQLLAAIEIATLHWMLVAAIGTVAILVAHLTLRHALDAIVASKAARGAGSFKDTCVWVCVRVKLKIINNREEKKNKPSWPEYARNKVLSFIC